MYDGVGPAWFGILALIRNPVSPRLPPFPGMTRPVMLDQGNYGKSRRNTETDWIPGRAIISFRLLS